MFKLNAPAVTRRPKYYNKDHPRPIHGQQSSSRRGSAFRRRMQPPNSGRNKKQRHLFPSSVGSFHGPLASAHYDSRDSYNILPKAYSNQPKNEAYHLKPKPLLQRNTDHGNPISTSNRFNKFMENNLHLFDEYSKPIQSRRRLNKPVILQPKLMVRDANLPDSTILDSDSHHPYSLLYMHYLPNTVSK